VNYKRISLLMRCFAKNAKQTFEQTPTLVIMFGTLMRLFKN
jgi:hypothetical protein